MKKCCNVKLEKTYRLVYWKKVYSISYRSSRTKVFCEKYYKFDRYILYSQKMLISKEKEMENPIVFEVEKEINKEK